MCTSHNANKKFQKTEVLTELHYCQDYYSPAFPRLLDIILLVPLQFAGFLKPFEATDSDSYPCPPSDGANTWGCSWPLWTTKAPCVQHKRHPSGRSVSRTRHVSELECREGKFTHLIFSQRTPQNAKMWNKSSGSDPRRKLLLKQILL